LSNYWLLSLLFVGILGSSSGSFSGSTIVIIITE
jgi:hypothetical protein